LENPYPFHILDVIISVCPAGQIYGNRENRQPNGAQQRPKENYMTITVGKLKGLFNGILETLESYEEDKELELQGNTYFTNHHSYVLQTPKGFLGLDNLEEAINGGDDE
jgi:hypothetical protein